MGWTKYFSNSGSSLSALFHSLVNCFLRGWICRFKFEKFHLTVKFSLITHFFTGETIPPEEGRLKIEEIAEFYFWGNSWSQQKCGNMAYINFWAILFTLFLFWRADFNKNILYRVVSKKPLKEKTLGWVAGSSTGLEEPMEKRPMSFMGHVKAVSALPCTNMAEERFSHERRWKLKSFQNWTEQMYLIKDNKFSMASTRVEAWEKHPLEEEHWKHCEVCIQ